MSWGVVLIDTKHYPKKYHGGGSVNGYKALP